MAFEQLGQVQVDRGDLRQPLPALQGAAMAGQRQLVETVFPALLQTALQVAVNVQGLGA
ncbi:hypothetical protein D3C77_553030 [compost metagenome]